MSFSDSIKKKIKIEVVDQSSSASASSQSPENVTVDFPDVTNVKVPDPLTASSRWYSKDFKTKEDLEAMTKDQIIKYAESKGYKIVRSKRKSEIIEDILRQQTRNKRSSN